MYLIPVVYTWFCIISVLYFQTKEVKQRFMLKDFHGICSRMFMEAMFIQQKKPWESFACITIGNWLNRLGMIK